MQIVQFIIDLFMVYYGSWCLFSYRRNWSIPNIWLFVPGYQHWAHAHYPTLPHRADCAGGEGAAIMGCGLLTSYLLLFINFYIQTYKKPSKGKKVANGTANGSAYVSSGLSLVASHLYHAIQPQEGVMHLLALVQRQLSASPHFVAEYTTHLIETSH